MLLAGVGDASRAACHTQCWPPSPSPAAAASSSCSFTAAAAARLPLRSMMASSSALEGAFPCSLWKIRSHPKRSMESTSWRLIDSTPATPEVAHTGGTSTAEWARGMGAREARRDMERVRACFAARGQAQATQQGAVQHTAAHVSAHMSSCPQVCPACPHLPRCRG